MSDSWVTVSVEEVVAETDAALCLKLESGDEKWVPKSQVEDASNYEKGDVDIEINIKRWFADKEDIS